MEQKHYNGMINAIKENCQLFNKFNYIEKDKTLIHNMQTKDDR